MGWPVQAITYGIIQRSGSKKSALLGKCGARSAPETQLLANRFLVFFAQLAKLRNQELILFLASLANHQMWES
jgi:hypothetical protein